MPLNKENLEEEETANLAAEPPQPESESEEGPDETFDDPDRPKKRNSGKTGPTSAAGRAKSAQNARRHGACARTLILPYESPEGWELLLARWHRTYTPEDDSLAADFVLRTAQAEWHRIRTQHSYDDFLKITAGLPMHALSPEQIKMHDLLLRYKNSAERAFHREFRALETYYKAHNLTTTDDGDIPENRETPKLVFEQISFEELAEKLKTERDGKPWTPPDHYPT